MKGKWKDIGDYANLIKTEGLEVREYQMRIIKVITEGKSTLVVLPTGLGKTLIAVFAIAHTVYTEKKAVFLAPTKPLSEQHYTVLRSLLDIDDNYISLLTGEIIPKKRNLIWIKSKIVVATPQTIFNDAKSGNISLDDVGLIIFDECHRSVGKYAYTYLANECRSRGIQIVGLTASPGNDRKKIKELVYTLGIERIEVRTYLDPDVVAYVKGHRTRIIYVKKNSIIEKIVDLIGPEINKHLLKLYSMGISQFKTFDNMPKGRLIEMGGSIDKIQAKNYKFGALFNYVYVLNLVHAYDLLTTQSIYSFKSYIESLKNKEKKSRSVESILNNKAIVDSFKIATDALDRGEEHPKINEIVDILTGILNKKKVMVFAQYRYTISKLVKVLNENDIQAREFVGKKEGITRAQQIKTIEDFRRGIFNVLVSTSIGEEGLDIPAVDAVIFYEPVPSAIRNIQRRGRAGRFKFGHVIILVTRNTKDETYLMISRIKEKRMAEALEGIKREVERGRLHSIPIKSGQKLLR